MNNTITIMGGLGNQLFQIFALVAYSLKHETTFHFSNNPIQYGARTKTYWNTNLLKGLKQYVQSANNNNNNDNKALTATYNENGFNYTEIPHFNSYSYSLKLFGYFQSYKYFLDQQSDIFKLIQLRKRQRKMHEKTKDNILKSSHTYEQTVALHFRIGDYAKLQQHHPIMTLEYYVQALTKFIEDTQPLNQVQTWQVLYFCEEMDVLQVEEMITALKEHPMLKDKLVFTCIDHKLDDWEQMLVMSLCKHHIIANSTFSWWGAYLSDDANDNSIKKVYYPTTWFGPAQGYKDMSDLFPENWTRINI